MRTDAWAVGRGGEGVLLTTSARSAQGASVTSTQMDATEALSGFKAAEELAQTTRPASCIGRYYNNRVVLKPQL
nr:type VI secretion system Vgr family protein [Pseudoduganella buxea]